MSADSMTTGWYYSRQGGAGQQTGPVTWGELYSLAQSGAVAPGDLVWNQALGSWQPASEFPALFAGLPAAAQASGGAGQPGGPGQPGPYQPTAVRPPAAQPAPYQQPAQYGQPGSSLTTGAYPGAYPGGYGQGPRPTSRRSWLYWVIPLVILILAGGVLGAYFGFIRDGGDDGTTASTKRTTTTARVTTSTSARTTTTVVSTTTTSAPLFASTWAELSPAGDLPPARESHSMIYDSWDGKVILFGGWDFDEDFADTWAYDPLTNAWTELSPSGDVPAGRAYHSMVYDEIGAKVILFGGIDGSDNYYSDTWSYDPATNTWTDVSPGGDTPAARDATAMAFDPGTGSIILFGGYDDNSEYNDTWGYDPTTNAWYDLSPSGDVPPARDNHSMVYDPITGKMILFGGYDGDNRFDDTWAYDPLANTWTELSPAGDLPPARSGHKMVYDPGAGRMILFGGWDGDHELDDTWAYDPAANAWTALEPEGGSPQPRDMFSMVYDPITQQLILFGGWDGETDRDDTWGFGSFLPLI